MKVYYREVFEKYSEQFAELGVDANNGIGDVYTKIQSLTDEERTAIEADLQAVYSTRPDMAMVDSDRGITNLHVPAISLLMRPCPQRCAPPDRCGARMVSSTT